MALGDAVLDSSPWLEDVVDGRRRVGGHSHPIAGEGPLGSVQRTRRLGRGAGAFRRRLFEAKNRKRVFIDEH